jgi:arylformamidase
MTVHFLSYFLDASTPAYGGEQGCVQLESIRQISLGDNSNNSRISFPMHIGSHIDFPFHFKSNGKKSDDYPASFWVFNEVAFITCNIEELPWKLDNISEDTEILLFKTGFGQYRHEEKYWKEQPVIPSSYASMFKKKLPKLRVFGFDMISLTSKLDRAEGKKAHEAFLIDNDILILEDLNLVPLHQKPETVIIAPLLVRNVDGTPCSVFAFTNEEF